MPNRLIREGWLDSEAIDQLSADAERYFHRLCLTADDAGRFDGRRDIQRSRLFPLKASLRASDVEKWISECVRQGLVIPYEWLGKPYVQIAKWQRCSPCATSKFPFSDGSHRIEYLKLETRDGDKDFVKSSLSHTEGIRKASDPLGPTAPRKAGDGDGDGLEDGGEGADDARDLAFTEAWSLYPKRAGGNSKADALRAFNARLKEGSSVVDLVNGVKRYAAFVRAKGDEGSQFVKQASTFFGPGKHYAEAWDAPAPGSGPRGTLPPRTDGIPTRSVKDVMADAL